MRTGFDPAARGEVSRLLQRDPGTLPGWAGAGPVAATERWDCYQHDSGISVTWAWQQAPRQAVPATVLARLLAPGGFGKRVSLQYRPLPAGAAARLLEEQVNVAAFTEQWRARTGRAATARDSADRFRAQQAAAEEAAGAGVTRICLYVTTTVGAAADLCPARLPTSRPGRRRPASGCAACTGGRRPGSPPPCRAGSPRRRRPARAAGAGPAGEPQRRPPAPPGARASRWRGSPGLPPVRLRCGSPSTAVGPQARRTGPGDCPLPSYRTRRGGSIDDRIPGHHRAGLRSLPVRGRVGGAAGRHAGGPPPAVGRGGLPGPAGLAAGRPGHQPRSVPARPSPHWPTG